MQTDDAEVIDTEDEIVPGDTVDEPETDEASETQAAPGEEAKAEEDPEEVVVSIGDEEVKPEEDEHKAPPWVRDLRKSNREKDRRIRELEAKLQTTTPAEAAVVLGEKPTLEGCDYDAGDFEAKLEAWHERKRVADDQKRQKEQADNAATSAWQEKLTTYGKAKAALKVPDFEDAEAAALDVLSVMQQGVILQGSKRPELLIYAVGKNPAKAKELAAITEPVQFAFAAAALEKDLKVTPRTKTAPPPERVVRASGAGAVIGDAKLAELQAKAQRTGDYTEYLAAKRRKESRT